jgi:hypothetical protein
MRVDNEVKAAALKSKVDGVGNRAYTVATRERICQTEAYLSGSLIQGDL